MSPQYPKSSPFLTVGYSTPVECNQLIRDCIQLLTFDEVTGSPVWRKPYIERQDQFVANDKAGWDFPAERIAVTVRRQTPICRIV